MAIQLPRLARASRRCRPLAVVAHDATAIATVETTVVCDEVRTRGRKQRRAPYLLLRIPAAHRHRARVDGPPRRRWMRASALGMPLVGLVMGAAPAWGATTVNVTFHVPAQPTINRCFPGDIVTLNGAIHVVQPATADGAGGFHVTNSLNSQLTGTSITTGTGYVNSENKNDEWYARPPFSDVHTTVYDYDLISKSGTANYVMHMQMHQTVTANGMPSAAADRFWIDCRG